MSSPASASSDRFAFPGYKVAVVSTVAVVLTAPGQTMLVSLLNVPLKDAFGIAPLTLNTAYTVATVLASLPLVWVGRLTDRLGPRRMLALVALAFGGACLFTSLIAHSAMVFVAFFLLRFLGQGSLALVAHHALAMWFHRRLGTISGLRSVALFVAWAPLPALTLWLITAVGWRQTWALFGAVVALCVGMLSLWIHNKPEDLGLALDDDAEAPVSERGYTLPEARRTRAYWLLVVAAALPPMIGTAIIFDIQPLLVPRGISASAAAQAVSAWSLTMAVMALPSGRLVDRVSPSRVLAAGGLFVGASCVALVEAGSTATAMGAMALYAVGQSLVGATVGTSAARFFGRAHHGAIRSSLSRIGVIATGLGPLSFGLSLRLTAGYSTALVVFAVMSGASALLSLGLKAPPQLSRAPGVFAGDG